MVRRSAALATICAISIVLLLCCMSVTASESICSASTTNNAASATSTCDGGSTTASVAADTPIDPPVSLSGHYSGGVRVGVVPTSAVATPPTAPLETDDEIKAALQALYEPPPVVPGRSMRTARPKNEAQPPPKALLFNSTNVHELRATPINLRYIPKFLTPEECTHFINLGKELGVRQSPVLTDEGLYTNDSKRTSSTAFVPPNFDSVVGAVEQRIAKLTGVSRDRVSMFQIVQYAPGQMFSPHFDGNAVLPLRYTVFAYLNSVPLKHGGETDFPELGLRFQPEMGNAVFWENMCPQRNRRREALHQGLPPIDVWKYGLNIWITF